MSELDSAKRTLNRATYTPVKTPPASTPPEGSGRVVDKWGTLTHFDINRHELTELQRRVGKLPGAEKLKRVLEIIERSGMTEPLPATSIQLGAMPELRDITPEEILTIGGELVEIRERQYTTIMESVQRTTESISKAVSGKMPKGAEVRLPTNYKLVSEIVNTQFPQASVYGYRKTEAFKAAGPKGKAGGAVKRAVEGTVTRQHYIMRLPEAAAGAPPLRFETLPLTLNGLQTLAASHKELVADSERLQSTAQALVHGGDASGVYIMNLPEMMRLKMQIVRDAMYALERRVEIEPLGFLHLERLSFVPAGIERGELVHSVPLSPAEEVNISHKEWSNTSEEFERIVTDYLEAYSEEGVTEKSELTQATTSQQQHQFGFNMSVTATGGYGPVSISASTGFNVAESASRSQQFARNQSNELTRKASSRTKKEHKVSFRVSSASGTEDQAVRKIVNPFSDRAVRVDYYQLLRKWRVDLFRYGIRLTYDLTIPEPGSDILSKIQEVQSLQQALGQGFGSPDATLPWARFSLQPTGITRTNYMTLSALYGAAIEPPPANEIRIVRAFARQWSTFDESKRAENTTFDIDVPDDYYVSDVQTDFPHWAWEGHTYEADILTDVVHWHGASGRLTISVFSWQLSAFTLEVTIVARLKTEAYAAWQMRAWGAMRDAALANYEMNRANLKGRLQQLQEELGAQDALSLRKIEREEVTKGVLRWMFGPSFNFIPPGLPETLYGSSGSVLTPDIWAEVLAQGEIIKFIHHAIEWENMLYFLYPYFWSHTSRWDFKKYLDHPDFMHRTFLRSGSARVVLTLRPGFERDFVSFVETGTFDGLSTTHPYLTIAEEMQAYAHTNYPGIRPANPIEGARPLLSPMQRRAWEEMQEIIEKLERYEAEHGSFPTTAEGLASLAPYGVVPAADPWDHPYEYRAPGRFTDYELNSLGADAAEGGDGDDADITSWAEASLIGRWYEYTPTSALDIAFNETLPTA